MASIASLGGGKTGLDEVEVGAPILRYNIHSHLHFAKLCQKTRMGCSNWVAAQFKVLIVFHSGCSLNSKVCSWEQLRRRLLLLHFEAKRWDGGAIGFPQPTHSQISLVPASQWAALSLVEQPKLGQSRRPAQDLCRLQEGFSPGGTRVFLQRINRICATVNWVYGKASNPKFKSFLSQPSEIYPPSPLLTTNCDLSINWHLWFCSNWTFQSQSQIQYEPICSTCW